MRARKVEDSDLSPEDLVECFRGQIATDAVLITQHAQREMIEEEIHLDEVYEAIVSSQVLENYPDHRRGACCLVGGYTKRGRPLHVVCTTARSELILITVYEPKPPKWISPTERGQRT